MHRAVTRTTPLPRGQFRRCRGQQPRLLLGTPQATTIVGGNLAPCWLANGALGGSDTLQSPRLEGPEGRLQSAPQTVLAPDLAEQIYDPSCPGG